MSAIDEKSFDFLRIAGMLGLTQSATVGTGAPTTHLNEIVSGQFPYEKVDPTDLPHFPSFFRRFLAWRLPGSHQ